MRIIGRRSSTGLRTSERGESQLGCIALLAVVAVLAWIGFKIGSVHFDRSSLDEKVGTEISFFQAKKDEEMIEAIFAEAQKLGIPITEDDIIINRPSKQRIEIRIQWDVDVVFPLDKHFRKTMVIEKEAHTI